MRWATTHNDIGLPIADPRASSDRSPKHPSPGLVGERQEHSKFMTYLLEKGRVAEGTFSSVLIAIRSAFCGPTASTHAKGTVCIVNRWKPFAVPDDYIR